MQSPQIAEDLPVQGPHHFDLDVQFFSFAKLLRCDRSTSGNVAPNLSRTPCSSTHPVGGLSLPRGAERSSAEMEKDYGVISVMNVPKFAASAPGGN